MNGNEQDCRDKEKGTGVLFKLHDWVGSLCGIPCILRTAGCRVQEKCTWELRFKGTDTYIPTA
jgi:hypothetical protein